MDTLVQIINIVYLHLVHLLLKYRPDFIINRIQIRTVIGSQSFGRMKAGVSVERRSTALFPSRDELARCPAER